MQGAKMAVTVSRRIAQASLLYDGHTTYDIYRDTFHLFGYSCLVYRSTAVLDNILDVHAHPCAHNGRMDLGNRLL